jgi:hypothetical protein
MEQSFENENNIMKNEFCEIFMNENIMEEVRIWKASNKENN